METSLQPAREEYAATPEPEFAPEGLGYAGFGARFPWARLRVAHVFAAAVLGTVFILIGLLPLWHTDVWGHLRFGEYMVREGRLPEREMFSGPFADEDAPYINYQWIAQSGAYLLYHLGASLAPDDAEHRLGGGALMLAAGHAIVVTLRMLILLIAFRRLTGSMAFAVLGVFLVTVMGMFCHLFIIRPQVLGELGFAVLLLVLSRPLLSRGDIFLVFLTFLFWANAHGSFPIGFILLGLGLAGHMLTVALALPLPGTEHGSHRARALLWLRQTCTALWHDLQLRRLTVALLLGLVAAVFLNPHGPNLILSSWKLSHHPNILFMEEWKPLPLKSISGFMYLGSLVLLLPLLRWSPARFTPTQVLLLLCFGWQALAHSRVLVWWIMVVVWALLPHYYATYCRYCPKRLQWNDEPTLRKAILTCMVATIMLLWSSLAQWLVWGESPVGSTRVTTVTPVEVADYLRAQYRANPRLSRQIFASETQGDYLLWDLRLDPPVHVLCYSHVHLFTPEQWLDSFRVKSAASDWQEILDRKGAQFIVVEPDLHTALVEQVVASPEQWKVLKREPVFFARRKGVPEASAVATP